MNYITSKFEREKQALQLYHIIRTPTVQKIKLLLRIYTTVNCTIIMKDVDIAEKIFGTDIRILKGKITKTKPKPVRRDEIKIAKEFIQHHRNLTQPLIYST